MLAPFKIENINYHSSRWGNEIICYQKRYGDTIVSYCMNEDNGKWLLHGEPLVAVFRTKKIKQND